MLFSLLFSLDPPPVSWRHELFPVFSPTIISTQNPISGTAPTYFIPYVCQTVQNTDISVQAQASCSRHGMVCAQKNLHIPMVAWGFQNLVCSAYMRHGRGHIFFSSSTEQKKEGFVHCEGQMWTQLPPAGNLGYVWQETGGCNGIIPTASSPNPSRAKAAVLMASPPWEEEEED